MVQAISSQQSGVQSLFAGLGSRQESAPPGALLLRQGEPAERLYLLLDGCVELSQAQEGEAAAVHILGPNEPFILAAVVSGQPCLMSASVLREARLLSVDAHAVRREAARSAAFAQALNRMLAAQFRRTVRQVGELKLRDGARRVGAYLLRLADAAGASVADLPAPKQRIASRLGLSPESLSRSFALLRTQGVTVRGSRVVVLDRDRAEAFCRPDPLLDRAEGYGTAPEH